MKILLIHNFYRYRGGEDRYVNILEDTLKTNGHDVIRFFCDSRSIQHFNFLKKWLIPVKLFNSPSANRKLEDCLAKEKPDLAVVHNLPPLLSLSVLNVLKRNGIPILKRLENYKFLCLNGLFLRNDFTVCEKCKYGNFFHGIFHRCYQRSFFNSMGIALSEWFHRRRKTVTRTVDLFLAASEFVKARFMEAGFPGDKIAVRPNFIDFEPLESPRSPGSYAVFVGRLSQEKGLVTLLNAFEKLPGVPLRILGEGPLEKTLKTFTESRQMDHVTFDGFIDGKKKREIISRARFLVFPSECYESFGYSIIEGHACGVPVVASAIGGAKELVLDGENGFLFETGNPDDLEQKISKMMAVENKDLAAMKENALKRVKDLYTRETGYKNLSEMFNRLMSLNRSEIKR